MKTFNFGEKSLMAKLGYTTQQEIESLYEGWEESSFEARANGIPTSSFYTYLEEKIVWNDIIKNYA